MKAGDQGAPLPLKLANKMLRIPELTPKSGCEWRPSQVCPVPYRPDRNSSGSVLCEGKLFHDFASGETLDAPALLAKVEGLDFRSAAKVFIELAGVGPTDSTNRVPFPGCVSLPPAEKPWEKPSLPQLEPLTRNERRILSELRGLSLESVELVHRRGFLWGLWWRGYRAWALTDSERWNCQWRRLDGCKWERHHGGSQFTSWGAKEIGDRRPLAGWPIGICEAAGFGSIALVEGGHDLLAAFHFLQLAGRAHCVAAVCMLGVSRIDAAALPHFAGKRIRIFCHADPASLDGGTKRPGLEAAARWTGQLVSVGCIVDAFDFSDLTKCDGHPVTDLNDLAHICDQDYESERETLETLMFF